jgi:penicillin-binding protein 1A
LALAKGGEGPHRKGRRRRLRWGRVVAVVAVAGFLTAAGFVVRIGAQAMATLPSVNDPTHQLGQSSVIYDRNGKVVTDVPGTVRRQVVPISEIPLVVQHAFVAVEDKRFYQNSGLDIRGILRAAWADLTGHPLQGGSTITQQLAKNLYLTPSDTLTRKIQEAWLGIELAQRYTKSEILDQYLNWIYLGQGAWGVQAAAETYFSKPASQLTLPEAAMLAGINAAPSAYDPTVHPNAALARRNTVLSLMQQQGYITTAQEQAAAASPLGLAPEKATSAVTPYPYPWFVDAVITELEHTDHLTPQQVADGGLKIYTTLDPTIQTAAQTAVDALSNDGPAFSLQAKQVMQVGVAVIQPSTGDVVAIVGGRQHNAVMAYDRATQAERQPGSSIKPLVDYIPALLAGMTPGTVVDDAVETFGKPPYTYTPTNYDHLYYGLTTFTEALRRSVNMVAVKVLNRVGVETGLQNAVKMGLPLTQQDANLSLALGGTHDCCTPLNMADAYATIANGGVHVSPRLITKVVGPSGQVIVNNPLQEQRVIPANVAYVMTKMLEAVDEPQPNTGWDVLSGPLDSNWGTGYDATVHDNVPGWPTAGKTGTSNSNEDAWYVGFTPKYAAAVWLGYDKPQPFNGLYGGVYAGPIFRATMEAAVKGMTPVHFPRPAGVVQAPIDIKAAPWTVALPGPLTPPQDVREEWFVAGTEPTTAGNMWVQKTVTTSQPPELWQPGCPQPSTTGVFLNRKPLTAAWAQQMAKAAGVSDWQQLIPIDMSQAVPTAICGGSTAPPPPPANAPTCVPAPGAASEQCTVTLDGTSPLEPPVIQAEVGVPLNLTVQDLSGAHQFLVPALNISVTLGPGQQVQLTRTPQTAGTYPMVQTGGGEGGVLVVQPSGHG